ncbi:MAG: decaprenyl-phosphate phosphoribosyltransferase [Actinobacteria bacterium]|nr:decaprenyl-phosphate phosphoribosyltransferase [Actinomycetota bacterium]
MADAAELPQAPAAPRANEPEPPGPPTRSLTRALVAEARPRQWVKNVLVVAAPAAAGVLGEGEVLLDTAIAFVAFCLAASGTYFLNDAFDVEADRLHAKKRLRPIAAGDLSIRTAQVVGTLLLLAGVGVGFLTGWRLPVVVGIYIVFTTAYSAWLKHVAVVDLGTVAAGFLLRLIGGAVAVDVPISVWFLIVGGFGSLFMVAGKRYAEHLDLGVERAGHRATLSEYSVEYLGYVRSVASGVTMVAYCLWAFDSTIHRTGIVWFEVSIIPFVLVVLRYALLVERGEGGAPEEIVLGDRALQIFGVLWAAMVGIGLYAT